MRSVKVVGDAHRRQALKAGPSKAVRWPRADERVEVQDTQQPLNQSETQDLNPHRADRHANRSRRVRAIAEAALGAVPSELKSAFKRARSRRQVLESSKARRMANRVCLAEAP